jgi:hypothetical protein
VRYTAPSLVFDGPAGQKLETGGFQPIEAYDVVIANLDPTLERRPPANDPVEVLSAFPYALTTAAPSSSAPAAPAVRWALATLVLVCAFAIPATAVAAPGDEPARPPEDQAFPGLARQARAATAKLSTRPVDTQPTTPRAQPTDPGFDWGSAAAGAGRHRRPDRPRLAWAARHSTPADACGPRAERCAPTSPRPRSSECVLTRVGRAIKMHTTQGGWS